MNSTDPAFPVLIVSATELTQEERAEFAFAPTGMDLRTYMATAFMAADIARDDVGSGQDSITSSANWAVRCADALIERLNAK